MSEKAVIQALQRGDPAAFRKLVTEHQRLVYNTALGFVRNREEAEDVAQDVFVEAWTSIQSFKGESKISTWLYRITVNKCLDNHRRQNRQKRQGIHVELEGERVFQVSDFRHPGLEMEDQELAAVLMAAIDQLPDNQKVAFTLHKISDLSHKEMEEVMGLSHSAIESLIHRAKQNLRKLLEDYYRGLNR